MLTLDRSAAMSTTYGPDTAVIPFYQDGLYFDRQGKLVDMPHNRAQVEARGFSWASAIGAAEPVVQAIESVVADVSGQLLPPVATEPVVADDGLGGKSAAQVYAISQKLRAQLDVEGDPESYVPTLENMEGNLEFVRKHLKGE